MGEFRYRRFDQLTRFLLHKTNRKEYLIDCKKVSLYTILRAFQTPIETFESFAASHVCLRLEDDELSPSEPEKLC